MFCGSTGDCDYDVASVSGCVLNDAGCGTCAAVHSDEDLSVGLVYGRE